MGTSIEEIIENRKKQAWKKRITEKVKTVATRLGMYKRIYTEDTHQEWDVKEYCFGNYSFETEITLRGESVQVCFLYQVKHDNHTLHCNRADSSSSGAYVFEDQFPITACYATVWVGSKTVFDGEGDRDKIYRYIPGTKWEKELNTLYKKACESKRDAKKDKIIKEHEQRRDAERKKDIKKEQKRFGL